MMSDPAHIVIFLSGIAAGGIAHLIAVFIKRKMIGPMMKIKIRFPKDGGD